MERLRERRDRLAVRQLDLVLVLTAVGLLLITAAFLFDRSLSFALVDRSADTVVHSLTALAAGSLAALALARYRESGRIAGLFQASAFVLMALVSIVVVAVVIAKREADIGLTLGPPEQLPVYISSVTRVVAGAILLVGGAAGIGMVTRPPRVRRTLLAP